MRSTCKLSFALLGILPLLVACSREQEPKTTTTPATDIAAEDTRQPADRQKPPINRTRDETPERRPARKDLPSTPTVPGAASDVATTATDAVTSPSAVVAAPNGPAPEIADDGTTPGQVFQRINSAIASIDPIKQPRLSPETEQALQADLRKLISDAEKPGAFPKDTREGITLYADKMQFQLEEARKAENSDAYIRNLARCRFLLQELEPLLEQK